MINGLCCCQSTLCESSASHELQSKKYCVTLWQLQLAWNSVFHVLVAKFNVKSYRKLNQNAQIIQWRSLDCCDRSNKFFFLSTKSVNEIYFIISAHCGALFIKREKEKNIRFRKWFTLEIAFIVRICSTRAHFAYPVMYFILHH